MIFDIKTEQTKADFNNKNLGWSVIISSFSVLIFHENRKIFLHLSFQIHYFLVRIINLSSCNFSFFQ